MSATRLSLTLVAIFAIAWTTGCSREEQPPGLQPEVASNGAESSAETGASSGGALPEQLAVQAIASGNEGELRRLLAGGLDANTPLGVRKGTLLHQAAMSGKVHLAAVLLRAGADPNAKKTDGQTPLQAAVWGGHPELVKLLCENGARAKERGQSGQTALHTVALRGRQLCEEEPTIGRLAKSERSAQHAAAVQANLKSLEILLAAGADANAVDAEGNTPLALVEPSSPLMRLDAYTQTVKALQQSGGRNSNKYKDLSPTEAACVAAGTGDTDKLRALLAQGLDPDAQLRSYSQWETVQRKIDWPSTDPVPMHPLDADREVSRPLHWACAADQIGAVRLLLEHGAKAKALDTDSTAPLGTAIDHGSVEMVKLLLAQGADPNTSRTSRGTALCNAAMVRGDKGVEMLRVLLAAGADPNKQTSAGVAPIQFVGEGRWGQRKAELLLDKGARLTLETAIVLERTDDALDLVAKGQGIKETVTQAPYPLTMRDLAHLHHQPQVAEALQKRGVRMSMIYAIMFAGDATEVERQLRAGAVARGSAEMADYLRGAILKGHVEIVRVLLEYGANVNEPDQNGRTPLDYARLSNKPEMVELLRSHGAKEGKGRRR
ncbi:MAG: ankyrin repeat domain-containing protein [Armatimonadia bacterium]